MWYHWATNKLWTDGRAGLVEATEPGLGSGAVRLLGFRVQGSGFRVEGLGFRVEGLGLRVEGYSEVPGL